MQNISSTLIRLGVLIIIVGAMIKILPTFDFAPLPGDLVLEKGNLKFYFPIVTCITISVLLTIVVNIFFRK